MTTTVTPAVLAPTTQLTTSTAPYITCPVASQAIIKQAVFSNSTTLATTFAVWRVASGGSPGVTNVVIPTRSIAGAGTDLAPELTNMVLNAGDEIQCEAGTVTAVNFTASGYITT
jgi:hypothetical protein